jgi:uncharacterized LabA/DUF88 family protein
VYPGLISTRGEENEKSPRLSSFWSAKMLKRACVFIDGENLRHSLIDAFAPDGVFRASDYLPSKAQWADFYDWIVWFATSGTHDRLRAYWFVIQEIDCSPYGLSHLGKPHREKELKNILLRHRPFRERLRTLSGSQLVREMTELLDQLKDRQRRIEALFKNWVTVQNTIAIKHRAVEFRRAGAIAFNLFEQRFGQEKAVDVRLACDMIMLRDIYDTAIVVSGDQDYVPAVQVLKDAGKTVISVAFERRDGALLPGGARRLDIATDALIRVPYSKLRGFMGLAPLGDRSGSTPASLVHGVDSPMAI